jgi:hypothetical protein
MIPSWLCIPSEDGDTILSWWSIVADLKFAFLLVLDSTVWLIAQSVRPALMS